ncbi:unnamed protein product [Camellia sinensis]
MTEPRRLRGHKATATTCIAARDRPGLVATSGEDGQEKQLPYEENLTEIHDCLLSLYVVGLQITLYKCATALMVFLVEINRFYGVVKSYDPQKKKHV